MVKEKAKHRKKTIYFNQDNIEIFDYLNSRNDVSEYICQLIKADLGMVKEEVDMSLLLSKLDRLEQKISNINVVNVTNVSNVPAVPVQVEEDDSDSLFDPDDIFGDDKPEDEEPSFSPDEFIEKEYSSDFESGML